MQFCEFTNLMRSFINANPKNQRNGGNQLMQIWQVKLRENARLN